MPDPNQNRSRQRRIVQAAMKQGRQADLRWLLEADVPGQGEVLANAPPGWVPVVPVSHPDPRQDPAIVLLKEAFQHHNPRASFYVLLSTTNDLSSAGVCWYEYGEPITEVVDKVCVGCGAVGRVPVMDDWTCEVCR